MSVPIHLPQSNANDTTATLVRWLVASGSHVERGEPIAIFETTKTAVEVESPAEGWPENVERESPSAVERVITAKARRLMEKHGVTEGALPDDLRLVREQDIAALVGQAATTEADQTDAVLERADYRELMDLMSALRRRMKERFNHTIDQVLTGGAVKPFGAPTRIGRCCFIAPMAMIAPGADIGDHSFVAAFSYIEGKFPPCSYLAGAPARVIGRIEVRGDRVTRRLFETS